MAWSSLKKSIESAFAVFWFVLLFLMAILVATATLSASQLQSRLQALSRADTPVSVWQVERVRRDWNAQQEVVRAATLRVSGLRNSIEEIESRLGAAEVESRASRTSFVQSRNAIVTKLRLFTPTFVGDDFDRLEDVDLLNRIDKAKDEVFAALLPPTQAALDQLYDTYRQALVDAQKTRQALDNLYSGRSNSAGLLEQEERELAANQKKLDSIIDPAGNLSREAAAQIYDLISEFTFIEQFALGALYKFSVLPNEFLTIVLVVAMGVLGSTLQLTYDYYRAGGIGQTSLFFLRPMLGAITALVVFILLKAGVLVVTDSAKLGEVAPLNPFFIAFLGIVSGLLSENALETIRQTGQSWFRNSNSAAGARWAVGLKNGLPDGKTAADLSARTGLDADKLERWIGEKEPVPADVQKVIAAWLDRDVRTLFSNIPPEPDPA